MSLNDVDNILKWDILTMSTAFKRKTVSPVEVIEMIFDRIEKMNDDLNAYITTSREDAMSEAKKAEEDFLRGDIKGLLHGIPIGLKDMIYTKGIKTTMGSGHYKNFIPDYDATIVNRLKNAGAIVTGKLNTHELAYGPEGDDSYFGATKNPYDSTKIPGGSSNGPAVAVASHLCHAAIGTDTSGSVRIPASCCGIVGIKPTSGLISKHGVYPLSMTMDHVGPMTRNVMDNALLLNYLNEPKVLISKSDDYTQRLNIGLEGAVIGLPISPYFNNIEDEVKDKVFQAVKEFENLGAEIKIVDLSEMNSQILESCKVITRSEAFYVNEKLTLNPDDLSKEIHKRILQGKDYKVNSYLKAQKIKRTAINYYNDILNNVDILLTPTLPITPPSNGIEEVKIGNYNEAVRSALIRLTCPTNLLGLPSLSIPCGFSDSGLPIGMQLIGRKLDEANLYRFAYAYEQNVLT